LPRPGAWVISPVAPHCASPATRPGAPRGLRWRGKRPRARQGPPVLRLAAIEPRKLLPRLFVGRLPAEFSHGRPVLPLGLRRRFTGPAHDARLLTHPVWSGDKSPTGNPQQLFLTGPQADLHGETAEEPATKNAIEPPIETVAAKKSQVRTGTVFHNSARISNRRTDHKAITIDSPIIFESIFGRFQRRARLSGG